MSGGQGMSSGGYGMRKPGMAAMGGLQPQYGFKSGPMANYRDPMEGKNGSPMMMTPEMSQEYSVQAPKMSQPSYQPSMNAAGMNNFSDSIANFGMPQPSGFPQGKNGSPMAQDPFQAAIQNNNTANAKPLWMQQGPIDQAPDNPIARSKGIVLSEGQAKASTPPWQQNNPPINLPPNGGVPPQPTGPMQQGQAGWNWDNQRNQFLPQWTPQARQYIIQNAYGSGTPAPWMNKGLMNSEYTDPNFLQTIGNLSGNKFGG